MIARAPYRRLRQLLESLDDIEWLELLAYLDAEGLASESDDCYDAGELLALLTKRATGEQLARVELFCVELVDSRSLNP